MTNENETRNETTVIPSTEVPSAEASSESKTKTDVAVEQVVDSAVELGRLWARHGLTIGKMALETSAASLGTTARMLAGIADALAARAEENLGQPEAPPADKAA